MLRDRVLGLVGVQAEAVNWMVQREAYFGDVAAGGQGGYVGGMVRGRWDGDGCGDFEGCGNVWRLSECGGGMYALARRSLRK
ncbi:predicted protein [Sclerotinia sclerotiorum 1980 UF-70]|uniref:Uncharacterized protein n=1 Tax=Sclerotinia sclerotiorum (strain ATCC 18683 / 1980 / Ss-1) TaxID=665079 RepID=A7EVD1_SCLS1|nr:predicted protein [Sclerotinia sclerotiorum 1980 UF-70]EDN93423.1 predicted protein [Sclerotinia sclerotiorum 1980 UF-70]